MAPRRLAALLGVALVVGLIGCPVGAEAAPRRTQVTLSASSAVVTVGTPVTLTASARKGRFAATDRVSFQRRVGSGWRTVSTKRLGRRGAATVRITPVAGTTSYRVTRPATRRFARAASRTVRITAAPVAASAPPSVRQIGRLSLVGPRDVVEGTYVPLTAAAESGTFAVGDDVEIQQRGRHGDWEPLATVELDSRGAGTFQTFAPLGTNEYRAVAPGSISAVHVVRVRRQVTLSGMHDISVLVGEDAMVSGFSKPFVAGTPVRLEELRAAGWTTVATTAMASDGSFRLAVSPPAGSRQYRIASEAAADVAADTSATFTITVSEPAAPPPDPPTASINGPGKLLRITAPGGVDHTTFTAQAGQDITLAATEVAGGHGFVVDPRPTVFDETGAVVPLTRPNGPSTHRWTLTTPRTGLYYVYVQAAPGELGGLRLFVSTPLVAEAEPDGAPAAVSTADLPGRAVWVDLTAAADDYLSYELGGPRRPSRATLVDRTTGLEVATAAPGLVSGSVVWKVPTEGRYRLRLEPYSAGTLIGDLVVRATRETAVRLNGPTTSIDHDPGGGPRIAAVETAAGQEITVAQLTAGQELDWELFVVDAGGQPTRGHTDLRGDLRRFPADGGTYRIVMQPRRPTSAPFGLDVTTPVHQEVVSNGPATSLSGEGLAGRQLQGDFTAAAGDYVSFHAAKAVHGPTNPNRTPRLTLEVTDLRTGAIVEPADTAPTDDVYAITTTGRYRMTLSPASAHSTSLDLSLNVTRPVPIVVDAPATNVTIDRPGGARVYRFDAKAGQRYAVSRSGEKPVTTGARYTVYSTGAVPGLYVRSENGRSTSTPATDAPFTLIVTGPTGSDPPPLGLGVTTPVKTSVVPDGPATTVSTGGRPGREMWTSFTTRAGTIVSWTIDPRAGWSIERPSIVDVRTGEAVDRISDSAFQAPADGTYRLELTPTAGVEMSADVSVLTSTPRPIGIDGTSTDATVDRIGGTASFAVPMDGRDLSLMVSDAVFARLDGRATVGDIVLTRNNRRQSLVGTVYGVDEKTLHLGALPADTYTLVIVPQESARGRASVRVAPS